MFNYTWHTFNLFLFTWHIIKGLATQKVLGSQSQKYNLNIIKYIIK